ncbi:MAG TPA: PAS domain-containing protein [Magnetospirillaceae bacterium]
MPASLALVALPVIAAFNGPGDLIFPDNHSYGVAHSIFEAASFALGTLIFGAGWYGSIGDRSGIMAFLSTVFLAVGLLDLGHLLSIGGIPDFAMPAGSNTAVAFGFSARALSAVALFAIALNWMKSGWSIRARHIFLGVAPLYTVAVYWIVLMAPNLIPDTFIVGKGPTAFKSVAETLFATLQLLTAVVLAFRTIRVPLLIMAPLMAPAVVLGASELAFGFDTSGHDNLNVAGHIFKLLAFLLIYRFVFNAAVSEPSRLRAESEISLRRSREQLERAQRIGRIGSIETDYMTGQTTWSDELCAMAGLELGTPASLRRFLSVVHPDDREKLQKLYDRSDAGAVAEPAEIRILRSDGSIRWFLRRWEMIRGPNGEKLRLVVTYQDITDRREADQALQTSENLLREAAKAAQIGIYTHDYATDGIYWSPEQRRHFGFSDDETVAMSTFLSMIHPDDRVRISADMSRAADPNGDGRFDVEHRILRRDGSVRWLLTRGHTDFDADQRPLRAVGAVLDITSAKEAETRLQRSETHLLLAQQVGLIGSAEYDLALGRFYRSEAYGRLLGLDPTKPPTDVQFAEAVLPEDRHKIVPIPELVALDGPIPPVTFRIRQPDGQIRWLHRHAAKVLDADGKTASIIFSSQDITEFMRSEERLRRSEAHLSQAQRIGRIGSAEVDLFTGRHHWSDEYYRLLGLEPGSAEPGAANFLPIVHPEDRQKIRPIAEMAAQKGPIEPITLRVVHPNGEIHWLYRHAAQVTNTEGVVTHLAITVVDVTEFKRAEDKLRRSEAHLALAQVVGRTGSAEYDLIGRRHHRSDEYARLLGLNSDQQSVAASLIQQAVIPEDQHKIRPMAELEASEGPIEPVEFRVHSQDGAVRWLRRGAAKIHDASGRATALLFTLLDITDIKQSEERRLQLERQLAQAQKMEAVGQLTGGVAHDFNNLLAVVLGRLRLLEEDLADRPALREWTQICIRAAERGASLTRSLLAFSRLQTLRPESVELNSVVADMTELLRRMLGETIEIGLTMANGLWPSRADPGQVQTALLNLAVNARDAMPEGGRLMIETRNAQLDEDYATRHPDVAAGDYVLLSVSDNGFGMTAETLDRAFEPFFTTKDVGQGSGLGLSMVYGFAKQSGGHVTLYSEVGRGTTVRLYLPRAQDAGTMVEDSDLAADPTVLAARERGHETILVIEDNDELRDITQVQLDRLGYRTYASPDAVDGFRLLREHPETALLLCDVVLAGGVSGPQLVETALGLRPDLAIVFMTGYSGSTSLGTDGRFAGDSVLQKPFTNEDLARQVRAALDRKRVKV